MQLFMKYALRALLLLITLGAYSGTAGAVAGNVQFAIGDARLIRAGVTRALQKGVEVDEGDTIVTAADASAQIRMVDGGLIAVRPNTNMVLDTYRYNGKEDGSESAIVSLLRGGFRTITGIIGRTHKQNYLIRTETATIGIRGTDHEPMVILAPAPGQTAIAPPGTYDKVNVGVAFIRTDAGSVDIQRNQVGFAPITKAAPVILPKIPPFYKPTPEPVAQKAKTESKESDKQEAAADSPTQIRDTASTDPAESTSATATSAGAASAPEAITPVVAITATGPEGQTLNVTTQSSSDTGTPVTPPVTPPTTDIVNFSSTSVLRDELVWATTQTASGLNPAATTYIVSDKNREVLFYNSSGTPSTPLTAPLATPVTLTGPTNNTNFLFDASGNLTKILDTPHVVFDHGNDLPGSSTQFAVPTPLAHAQLTLGSGATAAETFYDAGTGVRFGRWSGGAINVTDLSTGINYVESLSAPDGSARSVQWIVAQVPSSLPLSGEFHYTRIGDSTSAASFATAPTDSYGNVGTLEGARLSADFTNMTASAGVRITMPSGTAGSLGIQNLSARFDNAPISSGGFVVSSNPTNNPAGTDNLHIGCFGAGCAPDISAGVSAYGGRIRGAFDSATGDAGTADGAFFRYSFNTLYGPNSATPPAGRVVDDYISGLVAFAQGPQISIPTSAAYPVAAPTGPVTVLADYSYNPSGNMPLTGGAHYWVDNPRANLNTDASGNLLSLKEDNTLHGDGQSLTLSGGTASPAAPVSLAIGSAASATDGSILLGWEAATPSLSLSGSDFQTCFGSGCATNPAPRTVLGDGLSWVRGPAPFPYYLPGAIAGHSTSVGLIVPGTATYDLGASIVHNQNGISGTVNSASLTANFGRASVDFDMQATTADGTWVVSAPGIRLGSQGSFNAHAGSTAGTIFSGTTVTPTSTHDTMNVSFSGGTSAFGSLEGQLMGIGLGGAGITYNLNGFPSSCASGPCSNVTASGALAFGLSSAQAPYSTLTPYQMVLFATGMNSAGEIVPEENYRINGGFVSPYRTEIVDNYPVRLDGEMPVAVIQGAPCTTNCGPYVNQIPVVYTVAGATPQSGVSSIGTATLLESGYDLATGIRWGRYGNGTVGVNDRISGASLGTLDATAQGVPFVLSTNQAGPTVLPISGTVNYSFVGGTAPADSNGHVGAALTAANAKLTANFTAQTVDASLSNLLVGGNTWGASATGIPIVGNVFQAETKPGGGGNLTVTSSLGTNTAGTVVGGFTGPTGGGVGMAYSLNHGGNNFQNSAAVTVSGVAVFKR